MACRQCSSGNQGKFGTEMNIHFPGVEGLQKATVWVFPQVMVCLDCGFAEFTVTETELHRLAKGNAA
jgi:hypothetical protein